MFFIICHYNVDNIKSGRDLLPLGHIDKLISILTEPGGSCPRQLLRVGKIDEAPVGFSFVTQSKTPFTVIFPRHLVYFHERSIMIILLIKVHWSLKEILLS